MKHVRAFFRFLYDFLVGDAWELFVGPVIALIVAWLLIGAGVAPGLVGGALFLAVLLIAALHLAVALRGSA